MPQPRGTIKITKQGGNAFNDLANWWYDNIPGLLTGGQPSSNPAIQDSLMTTQSQGVFIFGQAYLFYAEDVQIIVHTKDSENFQTTGAQSADVQTNQTPYREVNCRITITPRDADMEAWTDQNIIQRGGSWVINSLAAAAEGAWNAMFGVDKVQDYLNKRRLFLMDLVDDGKPVILNSTLFPEIKVSKDADSSTGTSSDPSSGDSMPGNNAGASTDPNDDSGTIQGVLKKYVNPYLPNYGTDQNPSNDSASGVSSQQITAHLISVDMTTPAGQQETVYNLKFREVTTLEDQTTSSVDPNEPGTAPLPSVTR